MADLDISQSHINTGTAAVSGVTVTGVGTAWAGIVRKGDLYGTHRGSGVRIEAVNSNTSLTLAYAVPALVQAAGPYEIQRTPYDIGYHEALEELLGLLGGGAFFQYNASGTLPERTAYDLKERGFSYLVTTTTPMTLYIKASATSGDWRGPVAYATGQTGQSGTIAVGTTTTLAVGQAATVTNTGTPESGVFNFGLPRGATGADGTDPGVLMTWGTATTVADPGNGIIRSNNASLAAATLLVVDNVNRGGSSLVNFINTFDDSTSPMKGQIVLTRVSDNAQAILNVSAITAASGYFTVAVSGHSGATAFGNGQPISMQFYRTGDAGAGTGDVVGPATSVAQRIAVFADLTGKLLADGGMLLSALVQGANNGSDFADKRATLDALQLRGANIASAAAVNLTNATGHFVDVTGTATTTSIVLAAGSWRLVRAAAAWKITTGANLVLSNGAEVTHTFAANDLILFVSDGTIVRGIILPIDGRPTMQIATARLLGRATAGTGGLEDLTAAQVWALLGIAPVDTIPATLTADKAYRRGNIVGTVSQSAGVPTGEIIERGSNANGEYVKFADGTLICTWAWSATVSMTSDYWGWFRAAFVGWTYPAAFAAGSTPYVSPNLITGGAYAVTGTTTNTASQFSPITAAANSNISTTGRMVAIGKWAN